MDLKILLKKFFPTISIVVIILCLSLMRVSPRSDMPEVPFGDKIVHIIMSFTLMCTVRICRKARFVAASFTDCLHFGYSGVLWNCCRCIARLTGRAIGGIGWPMSLESSWACGSVNMLCCLPSSFFRRGFFVDNGTISFFPFSVVFFEGYCKSYLSE